MIEFPFVKEGQDENDQPGLLAGLTELTAIARKLQGAGWSMRVTITGLAFTPPESLKWESDEDLEEAVKGLGITREFDPFPSRSPDELGAAVGEFFDRVSYERKLVYLSDMECETDEERKAFAEEIRGLPDCPKKEILQTMFAAMKRMEATYGDTIPAEDPFEYGMWNGKLSALRWAFGDEWDNLDT